ncbi:hypothetical protein Q8F55_004759 [Vanrija albida]|uniref:F-box domain-containing protein n=1 Tax=Vanrija albida TaxID=181172 RepID=A0ABR3Q0J0_9TREE
MQLFHDWRSPNELVDSFVRTAQILTQVNKQLFNGWTSPTELVEQVVASLDPQGPAERHAVASFLRTGQILTRVNKQLFNGWRRPYDLRLSATLPNEIVEQIVTNLDPQLPADRHALANLLRTSQAFWELAAPLLYHSLRFEHDKLISLLDGPDGEYYRHVVGKIRWRPPPPMPFSERKRRSFTFVRHFRLTGYLYEHTTRRLIYVSLPNTPLFPNVEKLCLVVRSDLFRHDGDVLPRSPPQKDFLLFDNPHVCAESWTAVHQLHWLPMKAIQSFTFHGRPDELHEMDSLQPEALEKARTARRIRIYDDGGQECFRDNVNTLGFLRPVELGLPPIEHFEYSGKRCLHYLTGRYDFPSDCPPSQVTSVSLEGVEISAFNDENCSQAPVCVVCDGTFAVLTDWGDKYKAYEERAKWWGADMKDYGSRKNFIVVTR